LTGTAELLPAGKAIRIRTGLGWNEGVVGSVTEPAAPGSRWGYTLASPIPVVSEDLGSDQRFAASAVAVVHGAISGAGVVIQATERPFGVLEALSTTRRSFSDSDVSLMQAVANVLATAVQRVEHESRMIEVRDNERRRIARDLHDEALQDLTDAIAQASTAQPGNAEQRLGRLAPARGRLPVRSARAARRSCASSARRSTPAGTRAPGTSASSQRARRTSSRSRSQTTVAGSTQRG
jgi:GAF domain-containing protein